MSEKKIKITKKEILISKGSTIILDMQWGSLMKDHDRKKIISQVATVYSVNRKAQYSLPVMITSVDDIWNSLFERVNANLWNTSILTFESRNVIELLPKDKLVYLTADTDDVCFSFDQSKYYIIGCLLDHNSHKDLCKSWADENGIQTQRLPIPEYITMKGRHVLTVNHVGEILIKISNGADWETTLLSVIPKRKDPSLQLQVPEPINNIEEKDFICNLPSFCSVE